MPRPVGPPVIGPRRQRELAKERRKKNGGKRPKDESPRAYIQPKRTSSADSESSSDSKRERTYQAALKAYEEEKEREKQRIENGGSEEIVDVDGYGANGSGGRKKKKGKSPSRKRRRSVMKKKKKGSSKSRSRAASTLSEAAKNGDTTTYYYDEEGGEGGLLANSKDIGVGGDVIEDGGESGRGNHKMYSASSSKWCGIGPRLPLPYAEYLSQLPLSSDKSTSIVPFRYTPTSLTSAGYFDITMPENLEGILDEESYSATIQSLNTVVKAVVTRRVKYIFYLFSLPLILALLFVAITVVSYLQEDEPDSDNTFYLILGAIFTLLTLILQFVTPYTIRNKHLRDLEFKLYQQIDFINKQLIDFGVVFSLVIFGSMPSCQFCLKINTKVSKFNNNDKAGEIADDESSTKGTTNRKLVRKSSFVKKRRKSSGKRRRSTFHAASKRNRPVGNSVREVARNKSGTTSISTTMDTGVKKKNRSRSRSTKGK